MRKAIEVRLYCDHTEILRVRQRGIVTIQAGINPGGILYLFLTHEDESIIEFSYCGDFKIWWESSTRVGLES